MSLTWIVSEPKPNPFEAVVGDARLIEVHCTKTDCVSNTEMRCALKEVVQKAFSVARKAQDLQAKKVLITWDKVYCSLVIVYTDDAMTRDSTPIVKCIFEGLDAKLWSLQKEGTAKWDQESKRLSETVKLTLIDIFREIEDSAIIPDMPILFSDNERNTVTDKSAALFKIHC